MLHLPASWVWDFWLADDGKRFHLYFLKASRALLDPDRRHWRATVGHAVSDDLRDWHELSDALVPSDSPAFDDLATWTGSIVRAPNGRWRMFYTGVDRAEAGLVQRIGMADSADLLTWHRLGAATEPDPQWYEQLSSRQWPDEAWRDPWVFRDPDGDGWHMLVTARANQGTVDERGVVGHAVSRDLDSWTIEPPLSLPDAGFGQLEVLQVEVIESRPVLIFSCMTAELSRERRAAGETGGIWAVNIDKLAGPYDISGAYKMHDERLYVGRLVQDRTGTWVLLAFRNVLPDGTFVGEITDPMPVHWVDNRLTVVD